MLGNSSLQGKQSARENGRKAGESKTEPQTQGEAYEDRLKPMLVLVAADLDGALAVTASHQQGEPEDK